MVDGSSVLSVKDLVVRYGDLQVIWGVSLEVPQGGCVSVLGANGAGKTSLLRAISGLVKAAHGKVVFLGEDISSLPGHVRVARGLSLVPDERGVFASMTVGENLKLGAFTRRNRGEIEESLDWVFSLFPILRKRWGQVAGTLSGGQQKMLAIGKALAARPKLLMLDEPSSGLAPIMVSAVYEALGEIRRSSRLAILLVEQNIYSALALSTHCYVLQNGRMVFGGPPSEVKEDMLRRAYLGA